MELERIQMQKAKDENDLLPKGEQLTIEQLGERLGLKKSTAYARLNGN